MEELHSYIEKASAEGFSLAQITDKLIECGWQASIVHSTITKYTSANSLSRHIVTTERLACVAVFTVSCLLAVASHYRLFR